MYGCCLSFLVHLTCNAVVTDLNDLVFFHSPKFEVCFTPVTEMMSVLSGEGNVCLLCVQGMPSNAWASPSWSLRKLTRRQWLSSRSPRQWLATSATGPRTFRRLTLLHTTQQWPLLEMQVPPTGFTGCLPEESAIKLYTTFDRKQSVPFAC